MQSTRSWIERPQAGDHTASEDFETHREYLFRSALSRLRNREQAEDAVQETFLAALTNVGGFSGNSTKKTWLAGILNHKVCDQLRNTCRHRTLFRTLSMDDRLQTDAATSATVGFTLPPRDPRTELESKELREALNAALQTLPPREARVYQLYESGFWSGREICRALQISDRNLWIILHRARKHLRESLSQWLSGRQAKPARGKCNLKKAWKPMESFVGNASPEKLRVCDLVPVVEFYAQNIED